MWKVIDDLIITEQKEVKIKAIGRGGASRITTSDTKKLKQPNQSNRKTQERAH